MSLESQGASADHAGVGESPSPGCAYPGLSDPRFGWDLVQRDWGLRQRDWGRQRETARGSSQLARIFAMPIAAVQTIVRSLARC